VDAHHALERRPGEAAGELPAGFALRRFRHGNGDRGQKCAKQGITAQGWDSLCPTLRAGMRVWKGAGLAEMDATEKWA
jgi:hypothetical protein